MARGWITPAGGLKGYLVPGVNPSNITVGRKAASDSRAASEVSFIGLSARSIGRVI
jgi:hypothetical protein